MRHASRNVDNKVNYEYFEETPYTGIKLKCLFGFPSLLNSLNI